MAKTLFSILEERFPKKIEKLDSKEVNFIINYHDFDKRRPEYDILIKKLLDLKDGQIIPKYFFDNLLDNKNLCSMPLKFGNVEPISMAYGYKPWF